jgi:hypothetical protein
MVLEVGRDLAPDPVIASKLATVCTGRSAQFCGKTRPDVTLVTALDDRRPHGVYRAQPERLVPEQSSPAGRDVTLNLGDNVAVVFDPWHRPAPVGAVEVLAPVSLRPVDRGKLTVGTFEQLLDELRVRKDRAVGRPSQAVQ